MRIHKSMLPRSIKAKYDKEGFIHGYLVFTEKDVTAVFMNDKVIFECSRPFVLGQTHLTIRYSCVVFTGLDSRGNKTGQLRELTFFI